MRIRMLERIFKMDEDMKNQELFGSSVNDIEKAEEAVSQVVSAEVTDAGAEVASAQKIETEVIDSVDAEVSAETKVEPAPLPVKRTKKTTIGGQALIEGIMMCGPRRTAIAVRKADGSIYVEEIKRAPARRSLRKCRLYAAASVSSASSSPEPRRS